MSEWFASGTIIDLIIAMVVIEAVAIGWYHRRTGKGPALSTVLANLLSGTALLLALRLALVGSAWYWIACSLLLALVAHAADLGRRWSGAPSSGSGSSTRSTGSAPLKYPG
jgi:hypothetical protein